MTGTELAIIGLASYWLTWFVTASDFPPMKNLRDRLLSRFPSEDSKYTDDWITVSDDGNAETLHGQPLMWVDGEGWMAEQDHWVGNLITCPYCAGVYVALGSVLLYTVYPLPFYVLAVAAVAAVIANLLD